MLESLEVIASALISASVVGSGAVYFVTSTIDKKMAQFENHLIVRLNGTYARTEQIERIEEVRNERYSQLRESIEQLRQGLNDIRKARE